MIWNIIISITCAIWYDIINIYTWFIHWQIIPVLKYELWRMYQNMLKLPFYTQDLRTVITHAFVNLTSNGDWLYGRSVRCAFFNEHIFFVISTIITNKAVFSEGNGWSFSIIRRVKLQLIYWQKHFKNKCAFENYCLHFHLCIYLLCICACMSSHMHMEVKDNFLGLWCQTQAMFGTSSFTFESSEWLLNRCFQNNLEDTNLCPPYHYLPLEHSNPPQKFHQQIILTRF